MSDPLDFFLVTNTFPFALESISFVLEKKKAHSIYSLASPKYFFRYTHRTEVAKNRFRFLYALNVAQHLS